MTINKRWLLNRLIDRKFMFRNKFLVLSFVCNQIYKTNNCLSLRICLSLKYVEKLFRVKSQINPHFSLSRNNGIFWYSLTMISR